MLNIPTSTATVKQEMSTNASGEHISDECSAKSSKEDEVESAKAQMSRVREENAKLKMLLEQIENDYKSLQTRFLDVVKQTPKTAAAMSNQEIEEEHDLVSLRLGRSSPSESKKEDITNNSSNSKNGLKLGLDCNFQEEEVRDPPVVLKNDSDTENRLVGGKKDEAGETWPPSKVLKTMRSGEDELSQPAVKRARVSVRARCDSPTLHDGCQWRKYGQKIAKGNPCPRAYYRCTIGQSCPVRKQVQRCSEDMSILITTYEGTHNHPLPISATAMASTTSAAASMLLSGSSTSQSGATTQALNLGGAGLSVNLSEHPKIRPFYLPNSPVPGQFPTITLDLTSTPSPHFNIFSSSFEPSSPKFPSLNFSSPESSLQLPSLWSNNGYFNYKASIDNPSPLTLSKQSQELNYQQYLDKNNQALAETLTKAITSDPSIRSVLAAAISSVVASGGSSQATDESKTLGQNRKWAEQVQVLNSDPVSSNGNKGSSFGSIFLNRSTSLNSQTAGSLKQQQQQQQPHPPFSFSISNSSSRSTVDNGDQTNS